MKSRILIISFSNLNRDPRVSRQIEWLKKDHEIHTAGYTPSNFSELHHIPLKRKGNGMVSKIKQALQLLLRQFESFYKAHYDLSELLINAGEYDYDLIIANDVEALPAALMVKGNASILLDAHEYAPRRVENSFSWRLLFQPFVTWICKNDLKKADRMITVCEGIAREYEKEFGVPCGVVTNAPVFYDLHPTEVNPKKIRLIHHGLCTPARKIETMVDIMQYLGPEYELDLMVVPPAGAGRASKAYMELIKQKVATTDRVNLKAPVDRTEIVPTTNDYDIGLFLLEPINFNYLNALPNKFFEFVQARLAIAIGPSPEMASYVRKFKLGVITEDYQAETMAKAIRSLTAEKISFHKQKSHEIAREMCAERNEDILKSIVEGILEDRKAANIAEIMKN